MTVQITHPGKGPVSGEAILTLVCACGWDTYVYENGNAQAALVKLHERAKNHPCTGAPTIEVQDGQAP